jgi:hypothetical protein
MARAGDLRLTKDLRGVEKEFTTMRRLLRTAIGLALALAVSWGAISRGIESDPLTLKAFLAAEDLDDVDSAKPDSRALTAEDTATIRSTLQRWRDAQAVSNLLLYPDLIPADLRVTSLFRGLAERRVPYFAVAAIVGFEKIDKGTLSAAERERVVSHLLAILKNTNDARAQRASTALGSFAGERVAPKVMGLLEHPDETVRHNLRAWLFSTFKDRGVGAFAAATAASDLPEQKRRRVTEEFKKLVADPPKEDAGLLSPLFAYIPNLRDFEPVDTKPAGADR